VLTLDLLCSVTEQDAEFLSPFLQPLIEGCDRFGINTPLRLAHFLAQVLHESGGLQVLEEIWGNTPDQLSYEGRMELGNTQAGDGKRYLGRGLIGITGRNSYIQVSKALGVDYAAQPERLSQLPDAVYSAFWFWNNRNLSELADLDDFGAITRAINGGTNGWSDRLTYLNRIKRNLGILGVIGVNSMKVLPDFPYFSQHDNENNPGGSCNVTSMAMGLYYLGIRGDDSYPQLEDQLYDRCEQRGLSRHDALSLKALVETYPGCKDDYTSNGSLADIRKAIDEGKPCVVHGYFTGFGHIVAVKGYDDKGFIVNDPWGEFHWDGYDRDASGEGLHYSSQLMGLCLNAFSLSEALEARESPALSAQYQAKSEIWLHRLSRSC
jgi:putative chitinase